MTTRNHQARTSSAIYHRKVQVLGFLQSQSLRCLATAMTGSLLTGASTRELAGRAEQVHFKYRGL